MIKLWIDDVRPAPNKEYFWVQSVNEAKDMIKYYIDYWDNAILIDLDHDAGAEVTDGGDYIKLLDWLEANNIVNEKFTFHIHSMNPVGIQNMRAIIQKNGWREI